ncbi:hypothetical protein [Glycomyces artemisiae]|uniref:Uncharacterized protein n=1 Tax=Glycomyces artemisiae TaxID=1076443 RepID=A0A2T0U6I5_9ACTN|nr:hypothetical protein [Glycomyces artemisiae]PRY53520.1 hypothetical protein B0I28_11719 [Glycomyces artemisiae]
MASKPSRAQQLAAQAAGVAAIPQTEETPPPADTEARNSVSTESRKPSVVKKAAPKAAQRTTAAARPAAASTRTKPVKFTVDLAPVEHRKLKLWCAQAADQLELPEVAASEVVRVAIARIQSDPVFAEQVLADLAANGGSRRGWA